MFGVRIDADLFRRYEITRDDPFSDAVGSLIQYDPETFRDVDPDTVLTSSMETEAGAGHYHQYHKEVLDKEPGEKIFLDLLSDLLCNRNSAEVVDFNALGSLCEFFLTGSAEATNEEIVFSEDAKLLRMFSKNELREQMRRVEDCIKAGQIAQLHPSSEVGGSTVADCARPRHIQRNVARCSF